MFIILKYKVCGTAVNLLTLQAIASGCQMTILICRLIAARTNGFYVNGYRLLPTFLIQLVISFNGILIFLLVILCAFLFIWLFDIYAVWFQYSPGLLSLLR